MVIMLALYALIIPIIFYLYLGIGLFYVNNYEHMQDDEVEVLIKEDENEVNSCIVMIYYGISEVSKAENVQVVDNKINKNHRVNKNKKSVIAMFLIIVGRVFNLVYFALIFALINSLFQKKRYNVDK
ncbi:hypothetical protein BU587_06165 [Staphylococcus agnetis]|nr:hypothetical protein BU587_06165 [Staphylococcus agnetis]